MIFKSYYHECIWIEMDYSKFCYYLIFPIFFFFFCVLNKISLSHWALYLDTEYNHKSGDWFPYTDDCVIL